MKSLILVLTIFLPFVAMAKPAALLAENGVFISGYDPVSYLTSNKAVEGNEKIQTTHKGVKVYFASEENKKAFTENPDKYIPAYNGYCAYAMAKEGSLVDVDPKTFKVIDGKTYLFYNGLWANTLKKWNKSKNEKKEVEKADQNWKEKHT